MNLRKSNETQTKKLAKCFLVSIVLSVGFVSAAFAQSPQLADDTLLVLLAPHSDRTKAAADLSNEAQAKALKDMHVEGEDYSIIHVQPPSGQGELTLQKIRAMMKSHPEIKSVGQNYLCDGAVHHGVPDDPQYATQWPLAAMRWSAAQIRNSRSQQHPARITILSSGVTPVAEANELGAYVIQYNATVSPIVQEPVKGYAAEGDIDASITGCLTNNRLLIAGSGCFQPGFPCLITMVRITSSGKASKADIDNGIVFAINHQRERGGPGPVNLSYGHGDPNTTQGGKNSPMWSDPDIQTFAQSLLNQGDVLVLAAGDTGTKGHPDKTPPTPAGTGTWVGFPPGRVVVVQGTDMDNQFDAVHLTRVQDDPAGAPGATQPAVISGVFNADSFGSSYSAPLWSSAIAMLISVNPHLTGAQAHQILLNTGTPITGSAWSAVIPAFDRAIQAARP